MNDPARSDSKELPVPHPLVTITIAAYKSRPAHLAAAVESALAQSWRDIEILVSDDSPDASLRSVVDRFGDDRVSYRHHSPRLGVARNHWNAFRDAKGEFIAVLNHDDLLSPTSLEKLVPPLVADPTLALSFCDHWVIDADGQRLPEETDRVSGVWGRADLSAGAVTPFYGLFAAQTVPMAVGSVFRRGLLPEHLPGEAGPAYDQWLTYLLCRTGLGAYYVKERLNSWRIHSESLTSQGNPDWMYGSATGWETAYRDANLLPVRPDLRRKAALAYYSCAVGSWQQGRRADCFRYGWRSLRIQPSSKGLIACLLPAVPGRLVSLLSRRRR